MFGSGGRTFCGTSRNKLKNDATESGWAAGEAFGTDTGADAAGTGTGMVGRVATVRGTGAAVTIVSN